ncbi:TRAP transporter small permease [Amphritea opalescens]|uniref:TRAP transporter small permease protein n=1 Tax=Amphritea opalescens TaxID=2490544 RepID=A0A430KMU1_9GAMM|nr:TRAP transporter small permease [Amphritea opalescens]RTE64785.1 TRAP transporter small permease [Amphritea opalescens]
MNTFQSLVYRLSRLAAQLSAVLLVYMVLHILLEIVLRSFFATSTFVLDEMVGYGVAAMTFLTLGYAVHDDALIRVNIVASRLRGRAKRALETLCLAMTLAMSCYITWYMWIGVKRNWDRGAVSESIAEVPLWIPEGLVLLGIVLFSIQLFALLVKQLTPVSRVTSE